MRHSRTRTYFVMKNGVYGIMNRIFVLILSFASRTIFIKTLGAEYLGVNGLYSNILSLLSLAELGIENVLIFSLYEPISKRDDEKAAALVNFYKKVYRGIAVCILIFGVSVIPFLKYIVNSTFTDSEVGLYYIFFLLNSVVSYLAVYKSTLIKAHQEQYIVDTITTITKYLVAITQIVALVYWKNFILYLVIMIIGTVIQNFLFTIISERKYQLSRNEIEIDETERKKIVKNVKSTFLYKVGQAIINYTDNILISIMLGTIYVGYYSNYSMTVSQIIGVIGVLNTALIPSIGNMATEKDSKKSLNIFLQLVAAYHILSAFFTICFILVFNDFITLWIGTDNLLSSWSVLAISLNFYIQNVINPVWMYREAYGLFNQIKYVMLFTAGINIILSIILGKLFGIAGIIIATGLARISTTVWYEPTVLYSLIFKKKSSEYYFQQFKYILCSASALAVSYFITKNLAISFGEITLKVIAAFVSVAVIFTAVNFTSPEYKFWMRKALSIFKLNRFTI